MTPKLPEFKDESLFQQALTHRSYVNENSDTEEDNESLEFLGDAVLGFLVGELIYDRCKKLKLKPQPKQLTRIRSALVDEQQLAKLATQLGIGKLMKLGKGAEKDKGRQNPGLLSDTFEAIIGAYYLDSKVTKVRDYVKEIFKPLADNIVSQELNTDSQNLLDSKGRFQQWALEHIGENPEYETDDGKGPDHKKIFTAEVRVKGKLYGVGSGGRKQEAEKRAADDALAKLKNMV